MTEAIEAGLRAALDRHGDPGAAARVLERVRALPATGRPEDLLEAIVAIATAEWQQRVAAARAALGAAVAQRDGQLEGLAASRVAEARARQEAALSRVPRRSPRSNGHAITNRKETWRPTARKRPHSS